MNTYKSIEIKTAEKFVETILRDCKETRSSDKRLLLEVWERQGLHLTPEQRAAFSRVTSAETVRRARQAIQERGLYRATEQVKQQRMFAESDMRKNI